MKKILLTLIILGLTSVQCMAAQRVTPTNGDGEEIGTASNPISATITGVADLTSGTIDTLVSTTFTATTGTVTTLNSTTGTIATLSSTTGTIDTLNSTTGTITTLTAPTLGSTTLTATTGTITTLTSTTINATNVAVAGTTGAVTFALGEAISQTVDGQLKYTGQFHAVEVDSGSVSGTAEIDWNDSPVQYVTLTGNTTFTFTNPVGGVPYVLMVTGAYTTAFPDTVEWESGVKPTDTATAGKFDTWVFRWVEKLSKYIGSMSPNRSTT